ncbi:MAG: hypothetical protein NTW03_02050 [Verrucomicrobia bacterium]|nr:hypothetical protein [Verrucomicrobiota bacterium]
MNILFFLLLVVCLVALAWCRHKKPALRPAEPGSPPPAPVPMDLRPVLGRGREHKTEHTFLKQLIVHDASEASRLLQNNLAQAERDEKCIRRAVFSMVVLFMLSLAGLGYCAILLPEVFRNPSHLVMRSVCYLGLGSLISQVAFLGYFLWHRIAVSRLHRECRRLVLALAHSKLQLPDAPSHGTHA